MTTPDPKTGPFRPDWILSPWVNVARVMEIKGIGWSDLGLVGAPDDAPLTPEVAAKLAHYSGVPVDYFLALEDNYRADKARLYPPAILDTVCAQDLRLLQELLVLRAGLAAVLRREEREWHQREAAESAAR